MTLEQKQQIYIKWYEETLRSLGLKFNMNFIGEVEKKALLDIKDIEELEEERKMLMKALSCLQIEEARHDV